MNFFYHCYHYYFFFRTTLGERLKNYETDDIKISASRGNKEITFISGKVYIHVHTYTRERAIYSYIYMFIYRINKQDEESYMWRGMEKDINIY